MKKLKLLCFSCLIVGLLGLIPGGAAIAFVGDDGGFDGGFDGGGDDAGDEGGDDDGAEDNDDEQDGRQGEDRDKDGHPDGHRHRGHHHHGTGRHTHIIYGWPAFGFGSAFGFGAFGYAPPPYYGYSPGGFRPTQPGVVYVEKKEDTPQAAPASQTNHWYYCREAEGYYPDVKECPGDWEQVPAQAESDDQE